jgi:hypothetical protein
LDILVDFLLIVIILLLDELHYSLHVTPNNIKLLEYKFESGWWGFLGSLDSLDSLAFL